MKGIPRLSQIGLWLLNTLVAVIGTAIIELPFAHGVESLRRLSYQSREYLCSVFFAFLLGLILNRIWKMEPAKWLWVGGLCWLVLGNVLLIGTAGSVWTRMSGTDCVRGNFYPGCVGWFTFTIVAFRMTSYAFGAWLSERFASPMPTLANDL